MGFSSFASFGARRLCWRLRYGLSVLRDLWLASGAGKEWTLGRCPISRDGCSVRRHWVAGSPRLGSMRRAKPDGHLWVIFRRIVAIVAIARSRRSELRSEHSYAVTTRQPRLRSAWALRWLRAVSCELLKLERPARRGRARPPATMPVPEAPVHEYHGPVPREHNVGPTQQSGSVDAKAVALAVQSGANQDLGLRVRALNALLSAVRRRSAATILAESDQFTLHLLWRSPR
jgi:hypothetical protein